jgi:hypothetical protein
MKKIYSVIAGLLLTVSIWSQAPKKMSYQAVVRNGSNALVSSTVVGMQISILQGSVSGTAVYVETHTPTTNANGLASLEIGAGVAVTGTMAGIDWANGPYFIKTETDPAGGTAYSISGTTELVSVPYALHSNCVPVSVSGTGDTLTIGCHSVIIPGISAANTPGGGGGGFPAGTVNCASGPTAIVDVTNPSTGKTWMDRNLGAAQVATSSTDANSYGDLYQWGRRADGHQCITSPTTATLSSIDQPAHGDFIYNSGGDLNWRSPQNDNLWQGVNGVNNPCPSGYRLPTFAELEAELLSWSQNNSVGAFASPLKLPVAGDRDFSSGGFQSANVIGFYWSSAVNSTFSNYLVFGSSNAFMNNDPRAFGFSVRCLKD